MVLGCYPHAQCTPASTAAMLSSTALSLCLLIRSPSPPSWQDLLSLGADVLARDRSGASPLFRACEAGHVGTAQCLLRAGADVTRRNSAGEAPLYIAALRGHGDVVRALLQHCQAAGVRWEVRRVGLGCVLRGPILNLGHPECAVLPVCTSASNTFMTLHICVFAPA